MAIDAKHTLIVGDSKYNNGDEELPGADVVQHGGHDAARIE